MKQKVMVANVVGNMGAYGRMQIPTSAIINAQFNPDCPIYIMSESKNHVILTQDGSDPSLIDGQTRGRTGAIRMIRGWKAPTAIGRQFQVATDELFDADVCEILVRSSPEAKEIYLDAVMPY